ncbi:MAG: Ig-like domain-containing protein [Roseburia sp.]|nr:Ig-like domain-containing protein [Roseburia sp.]
MKKVFRHVAAVFMGLALLAGVFTFTPIGVMTVQAADSAFASDATLELVDAGSTDLTKVKYWKGQSFKLSVNIGTQNEAVTWKFLKDGAATSDIATVGNKAVSAGSAWYTLTQEFQIAANASGTYQIVAQGKSSADTKEFTLTVEDKALSEFGHTFTNAEGNALENLWTGQNINLYVAADSTKGKVTFSVKEGAASIVKLDTAGSISNLPYFGAGSTIYQVTACIGETIASGKDQQDSATIVASCGGDTREIVLSFKQSASEIKITGITCDQCASHTGITHYDTKTNSIKLDKDQIVTIECELLGSYVEEPYISGTAHLRYPTADTKNSKYNSEPICTVSHDKTNNKTILTIQALAKDYTTIAKKGNLTIALGGSKSKTFPLYVYRAEFISKPENFKTYNNNVESTALVLNEGESGVLSAKPVKDDPQEVIKWVLVGNSTVLTLNSDTGAYTAGVGGTVTVKAIIQETNSGTRLQEKNINVLVKAIKKPDSLTLKKGETWDTAENAKTSEVLYVDEAESTLKYWINEIGDDVYYPNYVWMLDQDKVVTKTEDATLKNAVIVPKAKGTVNLWVQTEDGTVKTPKIKLTVKAPIKTISLKVDGVSNSTNSTKMIQQREVTLEGVRDTAASEDEKLVWSTDSDLISFVSYDEKGKRTVTQGSYTGDSCIILSSSTKTGDATIKVRATGLDEHSKATNQINVTVEERIPAKQMVFTNDTAQTISDYSDVTPYVIATGKNHNVLVKGYQNGQLSNDTYTAECESEDIAKVTWDNKLQKIVIAPKKPGTVKIVVRNNIDNPETPFWIKVVVPATGITLLHNGTKLVDTSVVTLAKGTASVLTTTLTPTNSTDSVTWTSSDTSAVVVDNRGNITGVAITETPVRVTATTDSGKTASCKVNVVIPFSSLEYTLKRSNGVAFNTDGTEGIGAGETLQLSVLTSPSDATDTYQVTATGTAVTIEKTSSGYILKGALQGKSTITISPASTFNSEQLVKQFEITVYNPSAIKDIKTSNSATGISVISGGLDVVNATTVYAMLQDSTSQEVVQWSASPSNVVELEPANKGTTHSCKITKVTAGQTATVTARTSKGAVSFKVRTGTSLQECTIQPIPNITYDGTAHKPTVVVKDAQGTQLKLNTDYTVSYSSNSCMNQGNYTVTVTGKGKYTGVATATFKILPAPVSGCTITVNNGKDMTYTGSAINLTSGQLRVVSGNNKTLTINKDYTVKYSNNINVGKATVTITGIGNYKGTATGSFKITAKDIARAAATLAYTNKEYTGKAMKPDVTVKDGTKKLSKNTDFKVTYSDNKKAGRATVVIKGIGNYTGSKTLNFTISKRKITASDVILSKVDYTYNKKSCKPTVTVKSGSVTLKKNTDYTVSYPSDTKSIGVKVITIIGKGNCTGNIKVNYYIGEKVSVKKPTIKSVKNSAAKALQVKMNKVSGAKGYEISYSLAKDFAESKTKVVTTTSTSKKLTKLTKGKTYYVRVRAYKLNSLGRKVYSSYSTVKKVKITK